ncbi:MAG: hypothetical protein R6X02_13870 [Enhygromyxa sp.]
MTTSKTKSDSNSQWLVIDDVPGLTIAPSTTPLTRLNYFDGKFLRASDLQLEQDAQRRLVHLSNLAGGFGVVHGFDTSLLDGDALLVGPGQAIDAEGRVLLLPMEITVEITALLERSLEQPAKSKSKSKLFAEHGEVRECEPITGQVPGTVGVDAKLWLITIAHAEFLCGEEDVYGKLCEQACVTSTDRPYRVEGVVLRARPLQLSTPLVRPNTVKLIAKHLRSQVASAYFADERELPPSLISGAGLRSQAWCLGAQLADGEVALGVLARQGASNLWFDAWTARRERIDVPARAYWAHRMAMRPWRAYLAQILQFQCQLAELLAELARTGGVYVDPCAEQNQALVDARATVERLLERWAKAGVEWAESLGAITIEALAQLQKQLAVGAAEPTGEDQAIGEKILIDGGIIELPPAGYLPVDPTSAMTVDEQVRRLLGPGVDLRFCTIRPDDVPREIEGAQHMDRISLLRGLDDPDHRPPVDVLVPEGRIVERGQTREGLSFRAKLGVLTNTPKKVIGEHEYHAYNAVNFEVEEAQSSFAAFEKLLSRTQIRLRGAARSARTPGGGGQVHVAALMHPQLEVGIDASMLHKIVRSGFGEGLLHKWQDPEGYIVDEGGMYGPDGYIVDEDAVYLPPGYIIDEGAIYGPHGYIVDEGGIYGPDGYIVDEGQEPAPIEEINSAAIWIDADCTADPFAVPLGSSLRVSFLVRVRLGNGSYEYRLSGEVQIDTRTELVGNGAVLGTLAKGSFIGFESERESSSPAQTVQSKYKVQIIRGSASNNSVGGYSIRLEPVEALLDNDVVLGFDSQTLQVAGIWVMRSLSKQRTPQMLIFSLAHDQAVQIDSDPDHIASVQAIASLANLHKDPSFAKQATNKLFPPPPAPSSGYAVEAVHDWVAFHARHRKQCEIEPAERPRPIVETRRFVLYTLEVDRQIIKHVIPALTNNGDQLVEFNFREVGSVDYAAGLTSLRSTSAEVEAIWRPHGEDRQLVWSGIASTGAAAAEGDSIATGRLHALEQVVETISPPRTGQPSVVLPQLPSVFSIGDADGAIVLLTGPSSRPIRVAFRMTVYGVSFPSDFLANPGDNTIETIVGQLNATLLLEATFEGDRAPAYQRFQSWSPIWPITGVYLYTRHSQTDLPSIDELDQRAIMAASEASADISQAAIDHVEYQYNWDEKKFGDVIVFITGRGV